MSRRGPLRALRGFLPSRRGGVATVFAVAGPALLMLTCGAVELTSLVREKSELQAIADAAALEGATELSVASNTGAAERAKAIAQAQLQKWPSESTLTLNAQVANAGQSMVVSLHAHRLSFFGNLLPPGGFNLNVSATATREGRVPLCVLAYGPNGATGTGGGNSVLDNVGGLLTGPGSSGGSGGSLPVHLQNQSQITAPACLIHSDDNIQVDSGAKLAALETQASGDATGAITPQAETGAKVIGNPFTNVDLKFPTECLAKLPLAVVYSSGAHSLGPGVHCIDLTVKNNASLKLLPGEHYFFGSLKAQDTAQVQGDNVVLVFDKQAKFDFGGNSTVSLGGRNTGKLAGFVVAASPDNVNSFTIESDHVTQLLGTLYIPNASLQVDGTSKVAQASAWTVVVAKAIQLSGSSDLVINANYTASTVPVPAGVGPQGGHSVLTR